jgi:hypothetical protein
VGFSQEIAPSGEGFQVEELILIEPRHRLYVTLVSMRCGLPEPCAEFRAGFTVSNHMEFQACYR